MPTTSYSAGIIYPVKMFALCLRPQLFSFSHPNPNPKPTHFPKHASISPNHQFSQGFWCVGYNIILRVPSQKFRLTPDPILFCNISETAPDLVPTWHKQSDFCLPPQKQKSSKQPRTFFQQTQNSNPIWFRLQQKKTHSRPWWRQESGTNNPKSSPCTPLLHVEANLRWAGYLKQASLLWEITVMQTFIAWCWKNFTFPETRSDFQNVSLLRKRHHFQSSPPLNRMARDVVQLKLPLQPS